MSAPVSRLVRMALAALATGLLLAGCDRVPVTQPGRPPTTPTLPSPVPTAMATITHGDTENGPSFRPPPFRVLYGSTELRLAPYTFCAFQPDGMGGCADGFDPDPPSIGSPGQIMVFVPVTGMTDLSVSQLIDKSGCSVEAHVQRLAGGWWLVEPSGPRNTYRVSLFATGEGAGDMVADLLWATPEGEGPELPLTCGGK